MDAAERVEVLVDAYNLYQESVSVHYDEVVDAVISRVLENGYLTKLDIAGLVGWKRLRANARWMRRLMSTPDAKVCSVTGRAVRLARDDTNDARTCAAASRSALVPLDGLRSGDALASTICYVAAPHRLAVYDQRAHAGLTILNIRLTRRPGCYARYVGHIEECRKELAQFGHDWTARQVDLALFQLGGPLNERPHL